MKQAVDTPSDSGRMVFSDRWCFRADADVLAVLNALPIKWADRTHAANALMRRGLKNIVPKGMTLREHPFDAAALDGPPAIVKKLAKKAKAMRPAKRKAK
jgi:hypothetical protein